MLRRCAALLLAVTSLGLAACGGEAESSDSGEAAGVSEVAESESEYLDLGGLKYQVQMSRQLNPRDPADADYFRNLAASDTELPKGEIWFGVFMRVENESDDPLPSAERFSIDDTRGNEFEPLESDNVFAYRPETVAGKGYIPNPERLQAYAGTQGSLLLFKIPTASLDNRPLELRIKSPTDAEAIARVDLDV